MDNAKDYIGIPFQHNGRSFDAIDCIGLVKLYLNNHGIEFRATDGKKVLKRWYEKEPYRMLKVIKKQAVKINYENRQSLDVVVFLFDDIPIHAGVMVERNQFLHIFENRKSGISRIKKWKPRLYGIYRVGDN